MEPAAIIDMDISLYFILILNLKIHLINANLNTNITDCEVNSDPVITFE